VDPATDVHLGAEFLFALAAADLELLHRHASLLAQLAHVHLPKPALPDNVPHREPARDAHQLVICEPRLGPMKLVPFDGRYTSSGTKPEHMHKHCSILLTQRHT
jgi:hypothetical protein